jgi:hypothetical protein
MARRENLRPALIILDSGDAGVVIARITSQPQQTKYDVPIVEWAAAGLRLPSTARIHKLATMHKAKIRHPIGTLSTVDREAIGRALSATFSNW